MKKIFLRMKLRSKMMFLILLITSVIFFLVIGYLANRNRSVEIANTKELLENMGQNYANIFSDELNYSMDITRALAHNAIALIEAGEPQRIVFDKMLEKTAKENPGFLAVWTRWEPDGFDKRDSAYIASDWGTLSGVFDLNYYYSNGELVRYVDMTTEPHEEEDIDYGPYITIPKETMQEAIIEPYYYSFTGLPEDEILMTTTCVPVIIDNSYRGVVAIDIELESFFIMIEDIELYESGFGKLITSDGTLVAHPRLRFIGHPTYEFRDQDTEIINAIQNGESITVTDYSYDLNEEVLKFFSPIYIGNAPTPWSFALEVPVSEIKASANERLWVGVLLGGLALIILFFVIGQIAKYITSPIIKTTNVLETLSKGDLDNATHLETRKEKDELAKMAQATNTLVDGLKNTVNFALDIGNGKLDTEFSLLSENDQLGKALQNMRKSLVEANKEDLKRKEEDKKRSWANEGYAKFGEILRYDNEDIETLTYKIVKNLVEYLEATQGGIFVLNDDEEDYEQNHFLEMTACYAYDRRKFLQKKIKKGEGLVGTCFIEGKTNHMIEIPESYVKITSGLGEEKPNSLILVPLKLNEKTYGVIELASLNEFQQYQIDFIEKIGESIASTISTLKINTRTAILLEKSRQQAEEMKAQEEEMRQNMEELSATQEEMARKTSDMESILNALNSTSFTLEYDLNGYAQKISDSYLDFLGLPKEDVIGKHHSANLEFTEEQKRDYEQFWEDLRNGIIRKQDTEIVVGDKRFYVTETYAPMFDQAGNPYKIFKIANDNTKSKEKIFELEKELKKSREQNKK